MIHDLKIWPIHFQAIVDGRKRFEVRSIADRSFDEGDLLHLREHLMDSDGGCYTGREVTARVSLVHSGLGVARGYVCMSIELADEASMAPSTFHGDLARTNAALEELRKSVAAQINPLVGRVNRLSEWFGKVIGSEAHVEKLRADRAEDRVKDLEARLAIYDEDCAVDGIEGRDAVIRSLHDRVNELATENSLLHSRVRELEAGQDGEGDLRQLMLRALGLDQDAGTFSIVGAISALKARPKVLPKLTEQDIFQLDNLPHIRGDAAKAEILNGILERKAKLATFTDPSLGEPLEEVANKWIVNIKGEAGSESFEISVVREKNDHGRSSYGWFGEDKLLITHNGGPCRWPLTPMIWEKVVKAAHDVAAELNAELARKAGQA